MVRSAGGDLKVEIRDPPAVQSPETDPSGKHQAVCRASWESLGPAIWRTLADVASPPSERRGSREVRRLRCCRDQLVKLMATWLRDLGAGPFGDSVGTVIVMGFEL